MQTIDVVTKTNSYPIHIGTGLFSNAKLLSNFIEGKQVCVITNTTVGELYLKKIVELLKSYQCDVLVLPDGEQYKNLKTLQQIFSYLLRKKHARNTTLIALGGGVIGDMTGFAAACYQRGVAFVQIPTSLLAQVDASVGGKTAVNHALGKNMIGAFHQPQSVLIDVEFLNTLPDREFKAGIAEVIKAALIRDNDFFVWIEQHWKKLLDRDPSSLQMAINRTCAIKAQVVGEDEKETGVRAILNFGHTVAHALERGLGYGKWLHGEAVALGMVVALELSHLYGLIAADDVLRIRQLLKQFDLPITAPSNISIKQCKKWMELDKKFISKLPRMILLQGLGDAVIKDNIKKEFLDAALARTGFW